MAFARRPRLAIVLAAWTCASGPTAVFAQSPAGNSSQLPEEKAEPLKPEEIDQLAAPVALYPDALLAQVLMASTYPLEIVQAARWVKENEKLKGKELEEAAQKQPWDPSVKSLTPFPDLLAMMNEKLDWTQKLGDAFLSQETEVMDSVQRLRAQAKEVGNLKSSKEQKVEVKEGETGAGQVIVIESPDPQVVYVPAYDPMVVYGAWHYPAYPPYSVYPPGYVAAAGIISFGVGVAVGASMWGGVRWGWGGSHVNVNVNNYNRVNRTNISNNRWQHNATHRRGVRYGDPGSRQRYGREAGGVAAREAYRGRQESGEARTRAERTESRQQRAGERSASREQRDTSAFQGAGSGGRQARVESARGHASRQSAGSFRGGGGRGGGRR